MCQTDVTGKVNVHMRVNDPVEDLLVTRIHLPEELGLPFRTFPCCSLFALHFLYP